MEELLRLTRENNAMLKQLLAYIVINYFANKAADIY